VSLERIKEVMSVAGWWFLGGVGGLLIYQADNIILGRFLGPSVVTMFALTYRVPDVARQQIYQLNDVMRPGLGQLAGQKQFQRMGELYLLALRTSLVAATSVFGFLMIFNQVIVTFWVGAERFAGQELTLVFGLGVVYLVLFHTSSVVLTALLKVKELGVVRLAEGLLNLVLSLLLVQSLGFLGVAIATVAAGLATSGWYVPVRVFRLLELSGNELRSQVLKPLAWFTAGLSPVVLLMSKIDFASLSFAILAAVLYLTIAVGLAALFAFTTREIRALAGRLSG
jgi:O-antigen/teichoic acid export membrane protein